jgi:hypothetical protein
MDAVVERLVAERLAHGATCVLRVRTGSMTPLLRPGDAVRVAAVGEDGLRRGALLVVRQGEHLVTHRLVGWAGEGDERHLLLQGDACARPDHPVAPAGVVGVVVARWRAGQWTPVPPAGEAPVRWRIIRAWRAAPWWRR